MIITKTAAQGTAGAKVGASTPQDPAAARAHAGLADPHHADFISLFPFWWMFKEALTHNKYLFGDFGLWPQHPTLVNFKRVLGYRHAGRAAG